MKRWRVPLLLALLATLFMACFTWEYRDFDGGYSREARLNPWLAASRLLEANGLRVRPAPDYSRLPPQARVLVLATPLQYLDFREQRELLDWVKGGGHLVVELPEAARRSDAADLVTGPLDVQRRKRDFAANEMKALAADAGLRRVQLGNEASISARFQPYHHLVAGKLEPRWQARDRYGAHALRFDVGSGRVTVLSDRHWMHNMALGEADHAALLWAVVNAKAGDEVWLVHGMERPSLLALILDAAAPFLAALTLCVLVWLWAVSRRFGPLQHALPPARRRLAEHLEASGRYFMKHGGLGLLYDASRQRLLAQVQRRYPAWRRLPDAELAAQLAARARIEAGAVRRVLEGDAPDHILQFAADIRLINRLRKAL